MNTPNARPPAPTILPAPEGFLNYQDLVPREPLVDIVTGPWADPDRSDTLYLYLDGAMVESYETSATPGHKVVSVAGRVFSGEVNPTTDRFDGDGEHTLSYIIGYGPDHTSEESELTTFIVKCSKPGGSHEQPVDDVNDKLAKIVLDPPEADENTATLTLTIEPWKHIAIGDKAIAYFSGEPFEFPPVSNIGVPQTLALSQADLRKIPSGAGILVSYRITDEAGNSSGYAPSVTTSIWTDVADALEASQLFYPDHVTEIRPGSEIDLTAIDDRPLEFRVNRYAGYVGETVSCFIEVRPLDGGAPATLDLGSRTWPDPGPSHFAFDVPSAWIKAQEGGNLRCWYTSDRPGTSRNTRYTVGRLPVVTLPAPIVADSNEGMLDPDGFGALLIIEAPGGQHLTPFAACTMRITGITSEGEAVEWIYADSAPSVPDASMYFYCERAFIESLRDRPARFGYTIEGAGKPMHSEELLLIVGRAGAPGLLAPPRIYELNDGVVPILPMLRVTIPRSTASRKDALVTLSLKADTLIEETKKYLADLTTIDFNFNNYPEEHDGQEVDASYVVRWADGVTVSESESEIFHIGTPVRFGPPSVDEASNGTLDPFDAPQSITVLPAADAGLVAADTYTVRTEDANGNLLFESTPPSSGTTPSVALPPQSLTFCIGATGKVNYKVTRDGRPVNSAYLSLTVRAIPDKDPQLERVIVTEGPDRELVLSSFQGNAHYTVEPWVWMHAGQRYWITCRGEADDGTPVADLVVADGVAVTAGQVTSGLAGEIDRAWLDSLGEDSTLSIDLSVTFAGSTQPADAVLFRTTELTVLKQPPFTAALIREAVGDKLDPDSFSGPAHLTTEPHALIRDGLYYWAGIIVKDGNIDLPYPIATKARVLPTEVVTGLSIPIARAYLDLMTPGSMVTTTFVINLDGTDDFFNGVEFPRETYTVENGSGWTNEWDLEELNPGTVPPVGVGQTLPLAYANVTLVEARVDAHLNRIGVEQFGYTLPDYYGGVVLYIGAPRDVPNDNTTKIEFFRNWSTVRFAMTSLNNDVVVMWYDAGDNLLHTETVVGGNTAVGHDVRYASATPIIKSVRIISRDVIRLDHFKFLA